MLPDTNILSSELKDIFCRLDISHFNSHETYQLAENCENSIAGLCHGLHFLGKRSSLLPRMPRWNFPRRACVS